MRINTNASTNLNDITARFVQLQKQRQASRQSAGFAAAAQSSPVPQEVTAPQARKADTVSLTANPAKTPAALQSAASQTPAAEVQKAKIESAQATALTPAPAAKVEDKPAEQPAQAAAARSTTPTFGEEDLTALRSAFGKTSADQDFNAQYDLNNDGTINTLDLVRMLGAMR